MATLHIKLKVFGGSVFALLKTGWQLAYGCVDEGFTQIAKEHIILSCTVL